MTGINNLKELSQKGMNKLIMRVPSATGNILNASIYYELKYNALN